MAGLTKQQTEFVKLFKWAIGAYLKTYEGNSPTPGQLVSFLSVEGQRDAVVVLMSEELYDALRHFRKLTQKNRLHAARRLWSQYTK